LILGVSGMAFASVAPSEPIQIKKPTVRTMDMSKRKIIRQEKELDDTLGSDTINSVKRYNNVLTQENLDALENISRRMQESPERLMADFGADAEILAGNDEGPDYPRTDRNVAPEKRFANIQPPSLTQGSQTVTVSKEDVKNAQRKALKQMEYVGRTQLQQKPAPIAQQKSLKDLEELGMDVSQVPDNLKAQLQNPPKRAQRTKVELPKRSGKTVNQRREEQAKQQAK